MVNLFHAPGELSSNSMNSAFVGYEELGRSRRVLSTEADYTLLDLPNPSYPTKAEFIQLLYYSFIQNNS